jgi:hypothetical protein
LNIFRNTTLVAPFICCFYLSGSDILAIHVDGSLICTRAPHTNT